MGATAEGRRACEQEARACPRDVYVYFDNDAKVRAPFDAMGLEAKVRERMGEVVGTRDNRKAYPRG
jgi:uncharacterized protein YecE (DUF72 family)